MTINQYCKNIRVNILKKSLKEVANNDMTLYQNLWQFEHGNNKKFSNIYYYFNLLDNEYKKIFKTTIWELLTWE